MREVISTENSRKGITLGRGFEGEKGGQGWQVSPGMDFTLFHVRPLFTGLWGKQKHVALCSCPSSVSKWHVLVALNFLIPWPSWLRRKCSVLWLPVYLFMFTFRRTTKKVSWALRSTCVFVFLLLDPWLVSLETISHCYANYYKVTGIKSQHIVNIQHY